MSPPPPTSFHVPVADRLSWPGGRGPPMSLQFHPLGQTPGGRVEPPNWARLSTVAMVYAASLWESVAIPEVRKPVMLRATVEPGIHVQLTPVVEVKPA